MENTLKLLTFCCAIFLISSCTDKVDEEYHHYTQEEYETITQQLDLPLETYKYPVLTSFGTVSAGNAYHLATLGRVLFYDKKLSIDGTISCASCHRQEAAFADNVQFSDGINGQITARNSLPLGNTIGFVKYYGTDLTTQAGFFAWDESNASINLQSRAAIINPVEMGHNMSDIVQEVSEEPHYQILFKKAYLDNVINEERVLTAITEFINSISSRESRFDDALSQANQQVSIDFDQFTSSENNGKRVFNQHCSSCHSQTHTAIAQSSANNGLDMVYADKGMGNNLGATYNGVFKVPSLRNIAKTSPYMHDGRFATIEEVIEHYSTGIKQHENLSDMFDLPSQSGFNFTEEEKLDLKHYLLTLTDQNLLTEAKYADPFKF